jgi:hypothetical protein
LSLLEVQTNFRYPLAREGAGLRRYEQKCAAKCRGG